MLIKSINLKFQFLFSSLLLFSSIVPFYLGSFYDYSFLLISIFYWILILIRRRSYTKLQLLILAYFVISTIQLFSLIIVGFESFLSSIPTFLRINSLVLYIDILISIASQKIYLNQKNIRYCFIYPFILLTLMSSIWGITNSILGLSFRMGFPLYTAGYDPHVFGPAMACSVIPLTYIFFNFRRYFDPFKKNIFIKPILFINIISCFLAAIFCGSRGGILFFSGFIISFIFFNIYRQNNYKIPLPKFIKRSSLYTLGFFSVFMSIGLVFVNNATEQLSNLLLRSFTIAPVFTGTDASRPNQIRLINESIADSSKNLISQDYAFLNPDVGIRFFIFNQGTFLFLLFTLIFVILSFYLLKKNIFAACIVIAGYLGLIFASATILIPRFHLFIIYSLIILVCNFTDKNLFSDKYEQ